MILETLYKLKVYGAMPFYLPITLFHLSVQCIKMKDKDHSATDQLLTDAKVEAPTLWPPNVKNWLIEKDPDAEKDGRQGEKGMTEDKMVGWHDRLDGHEFEPALGVGDGRGSLACCTAWGCKESDMTELNWTNYQSTLPRENRIWAFSAISISQINP